MPISNFTLATPPFSMTPAIHHLKDLLRASSPDSPVTLALISWLRRQQLPVSQQPILMIGGEFVRPAALQGLVPWARKQQLTLPHIYVALSSAARPPANGDWQSQFYASFCTSFATPGSFCSGAAALDQGALLFADGIEMIVKG